MVASSFDTLLLSFISIRVIKFIKFCFPAVDYFERRNIPFMIAVNQFDGMCPYGEEEVRDALDLIPEVPIVLADVRERASSKQVLVELVQHVMARRAAGGGARRT